MMFSQLILLSVILVLFNKIITPDMVFNSSYSLMLLPSFNLSLRLLACFWGTLGPCSKPDSFHPFVIYGVAF
jgi:hypothetical protein